MKDIFNELSSAINPKTRLAKLEAHLQQLMVQMNDTEKEIQNIKNHDSKQTFKDHWNTLVDGDDVPPFSFM